MPSAGTRLTCTFEHRQEDADPPARHRGRAQAPAGGTAGIDRDDTAIRRERPPRRAGRAARAPDRGRRYRQNSVNSRPSHASQWPSTSPSSTATRPPRTNGRPAGWGGASTWPISSTRGMRTQVYGCFTLGGQDYGQAGSKAMSFDAPFRLGPFTVEFRRPPFSLRGREGTGLPVPLAQPRRARPADPDRPEGRGTEPAGHPRSCSKVPPAHRMEPCEPGASICSAGFRGRCHPIGRFVFWQTIVCGLRPRPESQCRSPPRR